MYMFMVEA